MSKKEIKKGDLVRYITNKNDVCYNTLGIVLSVRPHPVYENFKIYKVYWLTYKNKGEYSSHTDYLKIERIN